MFITLLTDDDSFCEVLETNISDKPVQLVGLILGRVCVPRNGSVKYAEKIHTWKLNVKVDTQFLIHFLIFQFSKFCRTGHMFVYNAGKECVVLARNPKHKWPSLKVTLQQNQVIRPPMQRTISSHDFTASDILLLVKCCLYRLINTYMLHVTWTQHNKTCTKPNMSSTDMHLNSCHFQLIKIRTQVPLETSWYTRGFTDTF